MNTRPYVNWSVLHLATTALFTTMLTITPVEPAYGQCPPGFEKVGEDEKISIVLQR